jgi:hypothetical protein
VEETNRVSFFLQANNMKNIDDKNKVEEKRIELNNYLNRIVEDSKKALRHNYIGNIFINLAHGFDIKSI